MYPVPPKDRAAAKAELAERREKTLRLAAVGWSYERIWREAGLGHGTRQAVYRDVKAAYEDSKKRQAEAVEVHRAASLAVIDEALEAAHAILHQRHLAVGNGKVVRREVGVDPDTLEPIYEDVYDSMPNLAAADKLVKFDESRRKLLGVDAAAKSAIEVNGTIDYKIGVSAEELEQL